MSGKSQRLLASSEDTLVQAFTACTALLDTAADEPDDAAFLVLKTGSMRGGREFDKRDIMTLYVFAQDIKEGGMAVEEV